MTDYHEYSVSQLNMQRTVYRTLNLLEMQGSRSRSYEAILTEMGIDGIPCVSGDCPLSNYLKRELGGPAVYISQTDICVVTNDGDVYHVEPTEFTRTFVNQFDMGQMPALERPERVTDGTRSGLLPGTQEAIRESGLGGTEPAGG